MVRFPKPMMRAARMVLSSVVVLAVACNPPQPPSNDSAVERAGAEAIAADVLERLQKADGRRVYVPVYSHVYHMDNEVFDLTGTLSIRNTDDKNSIYIRTAKYYDTRGKLVRDFMNTPVRLPPLATLEYIVGVNDGSGGSGANFIVEWMSDTPVARPVLQCVMIGTQSQQGVSFIVEGKELD